MLKSIAFRILIPLLSVGLIVQSLAAREAPGTDTLRPRVYRFSIREAIMPPAERKFNRAMEEADSMHADFILLTLDTYGGAVDVADRMRTRLLNSDAITLVFIENNAASAGALISIACDSIFMKKEATIGAAVVVTGEGGAAGEKYQSYFREKFRATAQSTGRDPDIAEAMVNPDVYIPGVIDSGKILTLTAEDALKLGYCNRIVEREEDIFDYMHLENAEVIEFRLTAVDRIIRFLTDPVVSGLLITVIFFGIFFELQSPGIGFPLIAAISAAVLYFTPLYLDGLAENWEILIFVIGILLIAAEIFVIPGFGVAGISGIILTLGGLVLSLVQNVRFDFHGVPGGQISEAVTVVLLALLFTIALLFFLGSRLHSNPLTRALVFSDEEKAEHGYTSDLFTKDNPSGKTGVAMTDLRPGGKVQIGDEVYDAVTGGEYIEKGKKVTVLEARGYLLKVEEC